MTYRDCIFQGRQRLDRAGLQCADPLLHMKQIIQAALDKSAESLVALWDQPLSQVEQAKIETFLQRRLTGEPFQYICGYEWFWNCSFAVGPGVLIPRPETERLVELALERLPFESLRIAELGAGSGNIGITLLQERPNWNWFSWENNPDSWPYLEKNLSLLPMNPSYHWEGTDFFEGAEKFAPFDAFVANPPYVASDEIGYLSKEVRQEPNAALDGGSTGLEQIRRLIEVSDALLTSSGVLLMEIGSDQGVAVLDQLKSVFSECAIEKDYAGLDRVAWGRK